MKAIIVKEEIEGDIDSWSLVIIRTLLISLGNFADLIISIIFFDPNCIAFFIMKFITIFSIFVMYLFLCYDYSYTTGDGIDELYIYNLFYVMISFIVVLVLEIAVLVLFIVYFSALSLIFRIFYYIHWVLVPTTTILVFKKHF